MTLESQRSSVEQPSSLNTTEGEFKNEKDAKQPGHRKGTKLAAWIIGAGLVAVGGGAAGTVAAVNHITSQSSPDNGGGEIPQDESLVIPDGQNGAGSNGEVAPNPTGPESTLTVEDLAIPAGLEPQAAGEKIIDSLSKWMNGSATHDLIDKIPEDSDWNTFIGQLVEENKNVATEALLVDDWENIDSLNNGLVYTVVTINDGNLKWFVTTEWSSDVNPENIEGYRSWLEPQSITEVDDGNPQDNKRIISVTFINRNNADKNEVEDGAFGFGDNKLITNEFTLVSDGVNEKIADVFAY